MGGLRRQVVPFVPPNSPSCRSRRHEKRVDHGGDVRMGCPQVPGPTRRHDRSASGM